MLSDELGLNGRMPNISVAEAAMRFEYKINKIKCPAQCDDGELARRLRPRVYVHRALHVVHLMRKWLATMRHTAERNSL